MRRFAIGLLASSLLTLLTSAQASGLGTRMERAMAAPSPAKTSRTRRLSRDDMASSLKSMMADGASLAVLVLGAPGGFSAQSGYHIERFCDGAGRHANAARVARAAEGTARQAGPILRETINALHIPDPRALFNAHGGAASIFLRNHAAEHLRFELTPVAARAYAAAIIAGDRGAAWIRTSNSHQASPRLADHIAHGTVQALLDVIGRHERSARHSLSADGKSQLTPEYSRIT